MPTKEAQALSKPVAFAANDGHLILLIPELTFEGREQRLGLFSLCPQLRNLGPELGARRLGH